MTPRLLIAGAVLLTGCRNPFFGTDDGPPPPPNHVAAVEAACNACTPSEAVHLCQPHAVGSKLCRGIPPAHIGEAMIVCGEGVSSQGVIGGLRWSSSDPNVASVTATTLTVTHCVNEVANGRLDAVSPGIATITLQEFVGASVISSASATVVVTPE